MTHRLVDAIALLANQVGLEEHLGAAEALIAYGESCVRILHRNMNCLGLPMVTIGVAQGDALGGGFESLLSFNVIIAERGAKFGFPENIFGLFPGMGAYSLVARRVGAQVQQPLACVVVGGMLLSPICSLLVIPVVFTFVDDLIALTGRVLRRKPVAAESVEQG